MNKKRILAVMVAVLAFMLIIPFAASAEEPIKTGWYTDKGYYEYFDSEGNQYKDNLYWIEEYNSFFRFDANGKMYNKEWYRDPVTRDYYYYEAGGYQAYDEVLYIDGSYYAFDNSGVMYSNGEFTIYSEKDDIWHYYKANANGSLVTNKWVWFEDAEYEKGGYWKYYTADGSTYSEEIAKVGNSYYYFYYDGSMLNDDSAEIFDEASESWKYIRAKNGGALYCGVWYKQNGYWYYYGNDCFAAQGYTKVGGTYYVFYQDGEMRTNTTYSDGTNSYFIDRNGVATKLSSNGWTSFNGNWYYCVDGIVVENEIVYIGNAYYYFDWNGKMLDNDYASLYNEETGEWDIYIRAKKGGALYCGAWYLDEEGYYSYYGFDCFQVQYGFKTIGSGLFYFEDGYAVKDRILELDDGVYVANASCALTKCSDGWVSYGGEFYYVSDNALVRDSMLEIGDASYIFNYDGIMACSEVAYYKYYDEEYEYWDYNFYIVDEYGKIITKTGWYAFDGNWYYINEDHTLYRGYLEVNGANYYMYPEMDYASFDYTWNLENGSDENYYLYLITPDGKYQKVTKDGYYITNYGKVLVENGKLFYGWKNVNGKFYYFDYAMVSGRSYEIYENDTYNTYYFDDSGVMLANRWIPTRNSYLYADAYGRLANGIETIGNKTYLFENYRLAYDSYTETYEGIYVSDSNAFATLLSEGDGWKKANGYWYYVIDGSLAQDFTYIYENDSEVCYYFDSNSRRMLTDYFYYDNEYYFDTYGRMYEGWKQIDGNWYYYNPDKCSYGTQYIDDNKYYFDDDGKMISNTSYYSWNYDMIFVIDAYGIIVDEYDVPDGIYYADGNAYLYKNGEAYHGWYGENYFRYGRMAINEMVVDNGNRYLLDNHGKYIRNGWYKDSYNDWAYADTYGVICYNEWLQLGGVWYYFEGAWMASDGVYYIEAEDKYAQFDEYGKFVKYVSEEEALKTGKANTWEQKNGKWYYYNSTGTMVTNQSLYLGNAWYRFDHSGAMISDCVSYDYYSGNFYYFAASGARITASSEWKLINGKWYYFNADSSVAYEWIDVNGTQYYVTVDYDHDDTNGIEIFDLELLTGYQNIEGTIYYFDASGACKGEYKGKGWLQLKDGDFVYFKDGKLLTDGIHTINGVKYYFYEDGRMLANDYTYLGNGRYVYATASGALYSAGWHNTADGWIYVDASSNLFTEGVYKIGGNVYFFEGVYWAA